MTSLNRILTILLVARVANLSAQPIEIKSEPVCPKCRVELRPVVTLIDEASHLESEIFVSVTRDKVGNTAVGVFGSKTIPVFDRRGGFLRSVGREGAGPGEHRFIRNVFSDAAGNLHTWDAGLSRHTVFSATGQFVRSDPASRAHFMDVALGPKGQLVGNGYFKSSSAASASAVQIIDASGDVVAEGDFGNYDARKDWALARNVATLRNGEVVVARILEYRIDVMSPQLREIRRYVRTVDWFRPYINTVAPSVGLFDVAPVARTERAWIDEADRLWMVVLVPSAQWRPVAKKPGVRTDDPIYLRPRYDTVVEVIDLNKGRLIVQTRLSGELGTMPGGYVTHVLDSTDGVRKVLIEQLTLIN